jgi:hypothetical protein
MTQMLDDVVCQRDEVSGPRRAFYFFDSDWIELTVKLFEAEEGMHEVTLTASDLDLPPGVTFVNIVPRNVRLTVSRSVPADGGRLMPPRPAKGR